MKLSGVAFMSLSRAVSVVSMGAAEGIGAQPTAPLPYPPLSSAKPRRGKPESGEVVIPSSRDSQAVARSDLATHSLISVVLPKPAGQR